MNFLPNVIFAIILFLGIGFFARNISKLKRNIYLGKNVDVSGDSKIRWKNMARIALGQSKMVRRPIAWRSKRLKPSSIIDGVEM